MENKNDNSAARINFYVKRLETFTWQDLVALWGLDEVDRLYTSKTAVSRGYFHHRYSDDLDLFNHNTFTKFSVAFYLKLTENLPRTIQGNAK